MLIDIALLIYIIDVLLTLNDFSSFLLLLVVPGLIVLTVYYISAKLVNEKYLIKLISI